MVNKNILRQKQKQPAKQVDLLRMRVSGSELARLLGVTPAAVTQGTDAGRFRRDALGRYALGTNVPAYCQALREAQSRREDGDHRAELDYWRARKLQQDVLEGRQELAEQIAATILDRLRAACDRLRAACAMHPDTADAVRALADELDAQGGAALDALAAPDAEQPQEDEP
jgi:hypothetical protein